MLLVNDQLQPSSAVRATDELITAVIWLVPLHVKVIPEYLNNFVYRDVMAGQLLLVKLVVELSRVELVPINQPTNSS